MDNQFIRGQRSKGHFYEDASLIHDKKQVDEVLEEFMNKDNYNPMLQYEVGGKTYEIPTVTSNNTKYTLGDDNIMNTYYAGIGSRETPKEIIELFESLGTYFAKKGLILRSGGADGSDKAFENGCDKVNGEKEIYLPWSGFNGSDSKLIVSNPKAFEIAEKYHPYWFNLKQGAQKLQARNSHQVLGKDLETLSAFVICWTKKGKGSGGTGQAIRIAKAYNIPVFDMGKHTDIQEIKVELKAFLLSNNILTESDFK